MAKKKLKSCETELSCKVTAALEETVKEDLCKADGSLKELIENEERTKEDQDK